MMLSYNYCLSISSPLFKIQCVYQIEIYVDDSIETLLIWLNFKMYAIAHLISLEFVDNFDQKPCYKYCRR